MKYYYAIFKKSGEYIEVEFPDLTGCVTFGNSWGEAIENSTDVLAAWLANAEAKFIKKPSDFETLKEKLIVGELIPIAVDEKLLDSYIDSKKINITLPVSLLEKLDKVRKKKGLKRSLLLKAATEEYLNRYKEE